MRSALEGGASSDDALSEALSATDPDDPSARWACSLLGRALGYLPRDQADDDRAATSTGDRTGAVAPVPAEPTGARRSRRGPLVAVLAVAALLAAGVAYLVVPAPDAAPEAIASPATSAPGTGPGPTATADPTAAPTTEPPADPLAVFQDPGMRALAEPFLRAPGSVCEPGSTGVNVQESVGCYNLAGGHAVLFTKFLNRDLMRDIRRGNLQGLLHQPGTTVSLRWKFVDPVAGTRIGIPPGSSEPGEGVRVRFIAEKGDPYLYFDQDSTAVVAMMTLSDRTGNPTVDLDELRSYWADPDRR
jgi:hypothetical protein